MNNQKLSHHLGKPSLSIPDGIRKYCLDLLIIGFKRIKKNCTFKETDFENSITKKLVKEIQNEQNKKKIFIVRVDLFVGLLDSCSSATAYQLDIRFIWNDFHPNSYLAAEAKCLFGSGCSRAGKYIDDGLMDFVNGKYSKHHSHGIMLGYILRKDIGNAIDSVKKAANARKKKTNQILPISKLNGFINYSHLYYSIHLQKTNNQIYIYHIFIDLY
jgi:hypothetical protein